MTIAFYSLRYTSHVFSSISNKYGKSSRVSPALAVPPSSIFFHTHVVSNSLDSKQIPDLNTASTNGKLGGGNLVKHDATIGIIGGVCTNSSLNFMNKVVELSIKDGQSSPPFVLCSDPILTKEILPDQRSSSSCGTKMKRFKTNHALVVENLRNKRSFLENSGARCIVMPCHILHSWYDEVSFGCSVPILHVGECVARELKEANLKPIETGCPPRIGVLANESTLAAGLYQDKLRDEVVLPDKATMGHIIIPALEALNKKDMVGAQNLQRIALQVLLVRAVNVVVLASDEMRELLPDDDPLLKKCLDPMDALARTTIKWARSVDKQ